MSNLYLVQKMPKAAEVEKFFNKFIKHYPVSSDTTLPVPVFSEEDARRVEVFFQQYKAEYDPFWASGEAANVWDVAGLGDDEIKNCSVLGWLLDCHGSHGQGNAFLGCFLASLRDFKHNENIRMIDMSEDAYRVMMENTYDHQHDNEQRKSRVDIVLEGAFLLFIEAKIGAGETGNQLERYVDILRSRAGGKPYGIVFLTTKGNPTPGKDADKIACLSWERLAFHFEQYIEGHCSAYGLAHLQWPFWAVLVRQFCQHIRKF